MNLSVSMTRAWPVFARSEITDTFAGFRSQIREGEVTIPWVTTGEPLRAECVGFRRRDPRGRRWACPTGRAGADVVRGARGDRPIHRQSGAQQVRVRKPNKIPLVDLKWQHAEIVDEVTSGLDALMANTTLSSRDRRSPSSNGVCRIL